MEREYRYSTIYKAGFFLTLLIAFGGGIILGKSYGLAITFLMIACVCYFATTFIK